MPMPQTKTHRCFLPGGVRYQSYDRLATVIQGSQSRHDRIDTAIQTGSHLTFDLLQSCRVLGKRQGEESAEEQGHGRRDDKSRRLLELVTFVSDGCAARQTAIVWKDKRKEITQKMITGRSKLFLMRVV